MEWLWPAAGVGWLLALVALASSRQQARRLAHLTDQYWALKYDIGELKAQLKADVTADAPTAAAGVRQTFVPLASVKRSS